MERLDANACLLLIDVQYVFDHPRWGRRNNPDAEAQMARILSAWRDTRRPVIHIRHISRTDPLFSLPGTGDIKQAVAPVYGEPVITKQENSAFIGTNLEAHLRERGITQLVIVGLTTDHCVSTTTRMAKNLGFHPILITDATATFDRIGPDSRHYTAEEIHAVNLASLHDEFADILDTAQVLERL